MAKHLHLVISVFLFGIISVYSAPLLDAEETENVHSDLSYENFKLDQKLVDQHYPEYARLSRVIRTPSNPFGSSRHQFEKEFGGAIREKERLDRERQEKDRRERERWAAQGKTAKEKKGR